MVSVIVPSVRGKVDTEKISKELKDIDHEIIVQKDQYREGKGITLQRAFKKAKGDRIVWIDEDLQIHPKYIKKYLNVQADIVVACKLHPCSKTLYPPLRMIITQLHAALIRILFNLPLRETQTGLKVIRREVIDREWKVKGFGHDIEVLVWAYHHEKTIVEMPVKIEKSTTSTVNIKACFKTLYEILWLWFGMIKNGGPK